MSIARQAARQGAAAASVYVLRTRQPVVFPDGECRPDARDVEDRRADEDRRARRHIRKTTLFVLYVGAGDAVSRSVDSAQSVNAIDDRQITHRSGLAADGGVLRNGGAVCGVGARADEDVVARDALLCWVCVDRYGGSVKCMEVRTLHCHHTRIDS